MKLFQVLGAAFLASALGASAARADEVKLIFLSMVPAEAPVLAGSYHPWVDRVNAAGKGLVHIEERDGYALANLDNVYNRVLDDVVQIAFAQQNAIAGKFIRSTMAGLPFVSVDSETASLALWRLYASGQISAEYDDIVPLFLTVFPQSGIHFTHPIAALDDLKGLKLIAVGKAQADAVTALGGAPLSIPLTETYTALQRGAADGAVASWSTFKPFRLGDVTRYHVEAQLGTSTGMVFMAKKRFNALPPAAQKVLMDNSGEGMSRSFGAYIDSEAKDTRDGVIKAKQVVTAPSPKQVEAWRKKVTPNDTAYANTVPNGPAILDSYRKLLSGAQK
ncbi:MAG TPA: TRAP transporter substrate-binding protein DctP [Stellaceae bacterium]|jgi:TRAP-type C4-dicarboxylate transport system substrate-binding protein|nr:TRAP transporter substrate-binding protein DctP [Stellaceae bacterium]